MAKPCPKTVGESLYWCYANLAMMECVLEDKVQSPLKPHFQVRARLYSRLCKGEWNPSGFFQDERLKLTLPACCWYCGAAENLSIDHMVAQEAGGPHTGENLVHACRSCNSSKGSKDFLLWMAQRNQFPPLYLLRRYLKMAIAFCRERQWMDMPLEEFREADVQCPFRLDLIPPSFPAASQLCKFVAPLGANRAGGQSGPGGAGDL